MVPLNLDEVLLSRGSTVRSDNGDLITQAFITLNEKSPALASAFKEAAKTDEPLPRNLAAASPELSKLAVELFGKDATAANTTIDALQRSADASGGKDAAPITLPSGPSQSLDEVFSNLLGSSTPAQRSETETDPSRVQSTSLTDANGSGRYDMIFSATESLINFQLENYFFLTPEVKEIEFASAALGSIKSDLRPSSITVKASSGTSMSIRYHLKFASGTFVSKLPIIQVAPPGAPDRAIPVPAPVTPPTSTEVTFPIDNWEYVFGVNLEFKRLQEGSEEFVRVQEKLKPGNYRISQLNANLRDGQIGMPNFFDTQGFHIDETSRLNFRNLLVQWASTSQASLKHGVLGYSVLLKDDGSTLDYLEPSFPPTSQAFQGYPYMAPGQSQPQDSPQNMIVYLNMTEKREPPGSVMPYSGNWCTPSIGATMCISRRVFFERFLLPILKPFNEASYYEAHTPSITFVPFGVEIGFNMNSGNHSSSYFDWMPFGNEWAWGKLTQGENQRYKFLHGRVTASETILVANVVQIPEGMNLIRLNHTISVKRTVKTEEMATIVDNEGVVEVMRSGTIEIRLISVSGGNVELQVQIIPDENGVEFPAVVVQSHDTWWMSSVTGLANQLQSALQSSSKIQNMIGRIEESLTPQGAFVVPGAGDLLLQDPIFNKKRDLLFEANYNG